MESAFEDIYISNCTKIFMRISNRCVYSTSQVESAFEGARKITSEEYQAGERFAVQRHEDNLKLGTEVREYGQSLICLRKIW